MVGGHGRGLFSVEGRPHEIEPGTCFFARPGVVHQIVNTQKPEMELFWVAFGLHVGGGETGTLLRAFAESDVVTRCDEALSASWHAFAHLLTGRRSVAWETQIQMQKAALVLAIASAGCETFSAVPGLTSDARSVQARLAVRYVHDNLSRKLSLTEIANHVHVSPRQLSRIFASFVGTSPAAYIEKARLDRAEQQLLHTTRAIKEIAREVGFDDVAHFSRVFSRRFGNPPGDFRRRGGPLHARPSGPDIQNPGELV